MVVAEHGARVKGALVEAALRLRVDAVLRVVDEGRKGLVAEGAGHRHLCELHFVLLLVQRSNSLHKAKLVDVHVTFVSLGRKVLLRKVLEQRARKLYFWRHLHR